MFDKAVPALFIGAHGFASNLSDVNRAYDWMTDLRKRRVGWTAARAQMEEYLHTCDYPEEHVRSQVAKAETMMRCWLLD